MKYPFLCIFGVFIFCVGRLTAQSAAIYALSHPSQLRFTENKGQWDSRILFKTPFPNGNLLIEKNSFYFVVLSSADMSHIHHPGHSKNETVVVHGHAFRENFIGANPHPLMTGDNAYRDYANYYLGNKPSFWASGARIFAQMKYQNLYNGIDLLVYGNEENPLRYDFIVNPSGDASQIKLGYEGVTGLRIESGDLKLGTSVGDLIEQRPAAYQEINGFKKEVACYFVLKDSLVSFSFPNGYDKKFPIVIDPNIVFATYTGSTADNWGYTATYDNQGNMYVGGLVNAIPNPYTNDPAAYPVTTGAFQTVWGGGTGGFNGGGNGINWPCDIGIAKFSSDGTTLIYATYLGGNDNETPSSLVVDPQNNLVVYGVSYSTNFPVSATAYDATYSGNGDIIVTKFNSAGTALLGSTYIGGSSADGINYDPQEFTPGNLKTNYGDQNRGEVTIDANNNIYVASCTTSPDFPITSGAFQTTIGGGQDGCVFKLNSDCSKLLWSTFLGGAQDDACYSLNITQSGSLYVAGGTMSNNFPTTAGTLNPAFQGGNCDGFVTLLNNNGTQLLASSYIGTAGNDQVYFVKLDDDSNVYLMGQSTGTYPVQNAVYSNPNSGQFITKINPSLTSVFYSTVFGNGNGQANISPSAFLVDTCQNVYVAGWGATSNSVFALYSNQVFAKDITNLPLTPDALQTTTDGNDFYFFVMAKNAQSILYGSYFGGYGNGYDTGLEHVDGGTSRFDKRGIIYEAICAGCGGTSLTPSTPGVWSPTNDSWNCNELGLKIAFNLAGTQVAIAAYPRATGCVPLTVQFQSVISNAVNFKWYFGDGDTSSAINPLHTYIDTGTYHVVLIGIDSNSCNIIDSAFLTVTVRNDSLTTDFLSSVIVNCDSNLVTLSAPGFPTTDYNWSMGDNSFYSTQTVSHVYQSPGTYDIKLIETDSTKCNLRDTFTSAVTIPEKINANFTVSSSYGCVPLVVDFNTSSWPDAIYHWSFGDGGSVTSPLSSITHTYNTGDTFHVQLIVVDTLSCNLTDTAYSIIIAIDSSASATFLLNRTFYNCDSVRVTVWSTYKGENFQLWDFGDGTQIANVDSVSHMYNTAGTFTITHYLIDSNMVCKPEDTAKIVVSLKPLHVTMNVPDTVRCIPFTADFTGSSLLLSTNYYWFFADGDSSSGENVSHTYQQTGVFHLELIATDTNACIGIDSVFALITVINDSVHADFQLNVMHDCDSNLVVDLVNQSSDALQYSWNFGDGTLAALQNETHVYHLPGTYYITMVATDSDRCHPVDSITKSVTLLPNANTDFNAANVCLGNAIQFNNLGSTSAKYIWNFGDNQSSRLYSPSHLYASYGVYDVQLIIIDSTTCDVRDTVSHSVEIYQVPIAGFLITGDTFNFETPVEFTENSLYYTNLLWSFGDGDTLNDETSPTHVYEKIGTMNVCIEASNAECEDTMCKDLYISFSKLIGIPNAFSPNGDGVNDIITVEGKGIVEFDWIIYNRWGEKVFETHDRNQGWDGTYKGVLQEMDVYTYLVTGKLIDGEDILLKGNITLLR